MFAATNNVVARTSTDLTACGTFQNVWREIAANLIVHVRAPVTLQYFGDVQVSRSGQALRFSPNSADKSVHQQYL